jgi:cell division inhibitor SulA
MARRKLRAGLAHRVDAWLVQVSRQRRMELVRTYELGARVPSFPITLSPRFFLKLIFA